MEERRAAVRDALIAIQRSITERLEDYENVDRRDFFTDGELDLAKARRCGKLHLIRSVTMDEDGLIVSIKLHNDHSGYVYLIEAENGLVKIGRTEDVERRLSSINSASPICVTLLHSEFVKDAVEMERVLHDRFQSKRMRGEWFRLSESDVDEAIHLLAEARSPV